MPVLKDAKVGDTVIVCDGYGHSWEEKIIEVRKIYKTDCRMSHIFDENGELEDILRQSDEYVKSVKPEGK